VVSRIGRGLGPVPVNAAWPAAVHGRVSGPGGGCGRVGRGSGGRTGSPYRSACLRARPHQGCGRTPRGRAGRRRWATRRGTVPGGEAARPTGRPALARPRRGPLVSRVPGPPGAAVQCRRRLSGATGGCAGSRVRCGRPGTPERTLRRRAHHARPDLLCPNKPGAHELQDGGVGAPVAAGTHHVGNGP